MALTLIFNAEKSYPISGCEVHAYGTGGNYERFEAKVAFSLHSDHRLASRDDQASGNYTLRSLMAINNHDPGKTKISVLKIDLEGDEMHLLPAALDQGAFENVEQLALEFHLTNGNFPGVLYRSLHYYVIKADILILKYIFRHSQSSTFLWNSSAALPGGKF